LIFDVLTLDGKSLLDLPDDQRREVLVGLGIAGEHCRVPNNYTATLLTHSHARRPTAGRE
jgi:ATP-dependent DNA ligase